MPEIIKEGIVFGGGNVVDTTLDTTSTNPVENRAVATAIGQINADLTANSQKFEASYQNGKYGFMINNTFYEIGGGGMKCVKFDVFSNTVTVDITSLGFSSTEDYKVEVQTGSMASTTYGDSATGCGAYVSAKTATSFTITCTKPIPGSYQVISLV